LVVIVHLDGFLTWKKGFADEGMICALVSGRRRPALGTLKALCDAIRLGTAEIVVFQLGPPLPTDGAKAASTVYEKRHEVRCGGGAAGDHGLLRR
jgi:hypothetical protein